MIAHLCQLLLVLACLPLAAIGDTRLGFEILETREHDATVFTQGLLLHQGDLLESSGLYGRSFVRRYQGQSPTVTQQVALPPNVFAEGIAVLDGKLHLLSWRAGLLFRLDPKTLSFIDTLSYQGEGWGLTENGKHLIMSDGSSELSFREAAKFTEQRRITVHNQWRKFNKINELEFAEGAIWANVWESPLVLKIAPSDGQVLAIADLSDLVSLNSTVANHTVLNGIAYVPERQAFWITGKFWPRQYLLRFSPQAPGN